MLIFPDNTVFVHFAKIGRVDILERLFARNAKWTATVAEECAQSARQPHLADLANVPLFMGDPLYPETLQERVDMRVIREGFAGPNDHERKNLGEAETLSIIINRQLGARLITDDKSAYRYANAQGIEVMTTWDVLKLSRRINLTDLPTTWGYVIALGGQRARYTELHSQDAFEAWCTSSTSLDYLP